MEKDKFAMMKQRETIAKAFIDKMDKATVNDLGLIPAIVEYVTTGNIAPFEEYNKFHFIMTTEAKAERLQHSEELLKKIEEVERRNNEYREQYEKFKNEFHEWRKGIFAKLDEGIQAGKWVTLKDIKDIITKMEESGMRQMKQRKLYVKIGDEIKRVDSIIIADNKAIMEVGETLSFVTKAPHAPGLTMDEFEVIYNGHFVLSKR
jgi:hypothetical protein